MRLLIFAGIILIQPLAALVAMWFVKYKIDKGASGWQ